MLRRVMIISEKSKSEYRNSKFRFPESRSPAESRSGTNPKLEALNPKLLRNVRGISYGGFVAFETRGERPMASLLKRFRIGTLEFV